MAFKKVDVRFVAESSCIACAHAHESSCIACSHAHEFRKEMN